MESFQKKTILFIELAEWGTGFVAMGFSAMEYGVELDAIIGLDCLLHIGAVIDLEKLIL